MQVILRINKNLSAAQGRVLDLDVCDYTVGILGGFLDELLWQEAVHVASRWEAPTLEGNGIYWLTKSLFQTLDWNRIKGNLS